MTSSEGWRRLRGFTCNVAEIGLRLDVSRMAFAEDFLARMARPANAALEAMRAIEAGAVANVDEGRMVGHYWLRAPDLAPTPEIADEIRDAQIELRQFIDDVHSGVIAPRKSDGFFAVLVIGIGGSALGTQFLCDALGTPDDPMIVRFIDNTDPDGIDRILAELGEMLDQTLTLVISKSGGTMETRNAMLETAAAYARAGLDFAQHAVAITGEDSALRVQAERERWLRCFPMWEWVGGRTSVLSPVGLVPFGLTGGDVESLLNGARECDEVTRRTEISGNPAMMLALMWYAAGEGKGRGNMVVLPYRDRLLLFSRYLQQLVMESLGKEYDRSGQIVHQGLTVYGNKGSTDQHAFVQQLRDGPDDFFAVFIEVLKDREGGSLFVEPGVTSGDYLHGFLLGTREALSERGRQSMTLTLRSLDAYSIGVLIALFERAVGLYAELININAYHQPGVEAGKKAAGAVIELQRRVFEFLGARLGVFFNVESIAEQLGSPDAAEWIFHILEHAAAEDHRGVIRRNGTTCFDAEYGLMERHAGG
jgi:glucose-6-phosphate isomerase